MATSVPYLAISFLSAGVRLPDLSFCIPFATQLEPLENLTLPPSKYLRLHAKLPRVSFASFSNSVIKGLACLPNPASENLPFTKLTGS